LSRRRSTAALTRTGISEQSLLNTRCNVLPTTTWPRICLSELIRSAHCCSMRRWTLNGYMALIRSTSLTRSNVKISLRGICVLSVNEVARTWKVPSDSTKSLLNLRDLRGLPPIPRTDSISGHKPSLAYPPTSFRFIAATVAFEANTQFIKMFHHIRMHAKCA
jgi:hypothetical protein